METIIELTIQLWITRIRRNKTEVNVQWKRWYL